MTVLRVSGLRVAYGTVVAVRDVDLTLEPGAFLAVTGPSGAGKTSLLWALAAALPAAAGEVRYGEHLLTTRVQAAGLGVSLIPQGNGLVAWLTCAENVLAPLIEQDIAPGAAHDRVDTALARVGLLERSHRLVEELSGGQQQRTAIARGLASLPSVLLADEPTSDLDATNRQHVLEALREEAARGAIVVMTTHDPEAAEQADTELSLARD